MANVARPCTVERGYVEAGVDFMLVGADVALLARGSEALAKRWTTPSDAPTTVRASY